ncbi:Ribonuclease H [Melia azedarach]|uniref:Ribonuclease H n=1 Tax=Melia azedarach TaxID=155640 RepID=A0ACC1XXF4_MELAZ|nr:Ribonuclease H [Melia azedarach]
MSVLINGSAYGFFGCGRGVRQGDPLSPLLFCLAEDVLSRGISHLQKSGIMLPISTPRGCPPISYVLYADDVFIFSRGDQRSLSSLCQFLDAYSLASGQCINKDKSLFFLGKSANHRRRQIQSILGFAEGSIPFVYLGVPIFKGCPRRQHLQALTDRVTSTFSCWSGKLLSMAGRIELVRTVIQSLLMHSFKVYLWPRSLLSLIQTWARNFILSGSAHQRKMALVSWENFCLPRLEGGLGLRRLDTLNASCLLKSLWDIHTGCSVSDIYLQSRYFKVGNKRNYSCSSLWSGFNSVLNHFSKGSSWLIGDGARINLWHDSWLDKAILPCFGQQVFATKLSSVIKNGKWQFPILFFKAFPHLKESIMNLTLPIISGPDRLVWKSSRDGTLMLKDCYNYLRTRRDTQPWLSPLWKHFVPPRFAILTWKALQGRLPVDDILQTRGIYMVSSCSFCLSDLESNNHLFATCSFTKSLWLWTSSKFRINFPSCSTVSALWGWIIEKNFSPQLRNLWFTTACFVFHSIWRARNRLRYDNMKPSLRYIHTDILAHIRYFASFCPGYVHYGSDRDTLAELKIPWKLTKAPKSLILVWHAPPIGWIKVNTDGMAKGNPGSSACGGVFRDCDGAFLGGYGLALGHQTAYYSEIMGVILAIELAFARGWGKLWLESDSLSTIQLLISDSLLPSWNLQNR